MTDTAQRGTSAAGYLLVPTVPYLRYLLYLTYGTYGTYGRYLRYLLRYGTAARLH